MSRAIDVMEGKGGPKFLTSGEARQSLRALGGFLLDIAQLKERVILPSNGEELQGLAEQVLEAHLSRKPIKIFTPFCPDWSRDSEGRYDFKSLGGDLSFIAKKFFREAPPLLSVFAKHNIPVQGALIFANWGLETEIDAQDTYGRKLSQDDVQLCFASTFAETDKKLLEAQEDSETARIFQGYSVVPMTEFFVQQGVDPEQLYRNAYNFFETDAKARRLVEELHRASLPINKERLGLTEEGNRVQAVQNLAEYATLGQSFGDEGIIIAAESATTTRAYNLGRKKKLPVFYLKGKDTLNRGVNIL